MEYREFLENVRKEVESRYDSNVSVTLNHVMKNNGTELDGITIMEKDKNIAPTIYISSFYTSCWVIYGKILFSNIINRKYRFY